MWSAIVLILVLTLVPAKGFAQNEKGERIYKQWCGQCHGYEGDGEGYTKRYTFPTPRDFTMGVYKFRTTPTGEPPTDQDIIRSIRKGNPGTTMPPWKRFSDDEVKALTEYIKEFAPDVFEFEPEVIKITPPPFSEELIKEGREIFKKAKCVECHGLEGRGDGKKGWEENFKDDWGERIYPRNYTYPWDMRNGATVEDIFRTITTGLNGTPMTSYQDSLTDKQRWALAYFIKSLQLERHLGISLILKRVEKAPETPDDPLWDTLEYLDLPMGGQVIFEPRDFTPVITNVRVRGVYTEESVVIMLEWVDKKPDRGEEGNPPDAIRIQFPEKIPGGVEKPYFFLGDERHPVNVWWWKADGTVAEYSAKGYRNLQMQDRQNIKAEAEYSYGLYRVVFKRSLATDDENDMVFETGRFIPFSVAASDGREDEDDVRCAVSAWYYMMLEPSTPVKVYVMPPVVAFLVFGLGLVLHKRLSKS